MSISPYVRDLHGGPEFVVRYPNGDETQYVIIAFECPTRRPGE